ncbi:hypothetical protein YTPLAS73_13150 [Nitrosarchaeum sp.]|nr:hypothetical protein YTPLAS73_13150 [Nitrosarchaeum sp.]
MRKTSSKHITALTIPLLAFVIMSMGFDNAYAHKAEIIGDYKIEIGWDEEPPIQGIGNSIELVVVYATEAEKQKASAEDADSENMAHDEDHDDVSHESNDELEKEHDAIDSSETTHDKHESMDEHDDIEASHAEDEHDVADKHDAVKEDHDHKGGVSGLEDTIQMTITLNEQTSTVIMTDTMIDGIYQGAFTPSSSGHPVAHLSGMIHETEIDLDMHPEEVEPLNTLSPLKQVSHGIEPSDVQCKTGLELYMRVHEDSAICASSDLGERLIALGVVDYF